MATAKERWQHLDGKRDAILDRARSCADLTVPALMPPEGHDENTDLPTPYQSLGARGLNNLASKLGMALLPAGNPFFRLNITDEIAPLLQNKQQVEEELRKIENRAMRRLENSNLRVAIHATLKQLACTGNALLHMPDEGGARTFRLNQYVVLRDSMGHWVEVVIKESVHPTTLSEEILEQLDGVDATDKDAEEVDVYTHIERKGKKAEWYQEIEDTRIAKSEGRTKVEDCPYIPLRWAAIENEDYGRGHVEEYLGDLRSLEGLTKAIVQFAAVASKIIFMERPNSTTDLDALNKAESGEFVSGNVEDIGVLTLEKFPDFQVSKSVVDDLTLRLSHAFLLTTGTIRNAERVTAEEVRLQAQELEDVLGGVYSVLAQELQLPIVRRLMAQMRKDKQMPTLPEKALEPVIVTGFDALGRGHELNKYRQYFADGQSLFGEAFMGQFDPRMLAQLMATHHNVDVAEILKSEEMLEQEANQSRVDAVTDKAAGPVAGAMAGAAAQSMTTEE